MNWLNNVGYIDLINRVIVPSILMIITTIFKSRSRMAAFSSTSRQDRTFQKDVSFSHTLEIKKNQFSIFNFDFKAKIIIEKLKVIFFDFES